MPVHLVCCVVIASLAEIRAVVESLAKFFVRQIWTMRHLEVDKEIVDGLVANVAASAYEDTRTFIWKWRKT